MRPERALMPASPPRTTMKTSAPPRIEPPRVSPPPKKPCSELIRSFFSRPSSDYTSTQKTSGWGC